MKRIKFLYFALIILALAAALSGCAALQAKSRADEMLQEYFSLYNDENIKDCVDLFGNDMIDYMDDKDTAEKVLYSRRYILGEAEETNVLSFDSEGTFSEVSVVFEVEVYYENAEEAVIEEFVFLYSGKEMEIVFIDFGEAEKGIAEQMLTDYFDDYTNISHVKDFYIPYVIENLFDESAVSVQHEYAGETAGKYIGIETEEFTYYYEGLDWSDDIYYLAQVDALVEFEDDNFTVYAEISKEGDDVNFNYLEFYPEIPYNIINEYLANLETKDVSAILNMYNEDFFTYSSMTKDEWKQSVLDILLNDFGEFQDYEITSWEYTDLDLTDRTVYVYSFNVVTYYEDGTFDEYITIIKDENAPAVLGHYISLR